MPDTNFLDPNPPGLLRVPESQRASTSSSSLSSVSSYSSAGFDRLSKGSTLTDATPFITPLGSVDSIFGDDPQLEPLLRFSDFAWDGPTDGQWRQHFTTLQAQYAVYDARQAILRDLDEAFHLDSFDAAYQQGDKGFDAVAALRDRLIKAEPTDNCRRAMKIMEKRIDSGLTSVEGKLSTSTKSETPAADARDGVDDYADDFDLGSQAVLEMPMTPKERDSVRLAINVPVLEAISEADEGSGILTDASEPENSSTTSATPKEQPSLLEEDVVLSPFQYAIDLVCPPKPMITPVDGEWDCPSFLTSDTVSSDSISQIVMSPLQLDKLPSSSSPAIYCHSHMEFNPTFSSPVMSVSSLLFRSRQPPPTLVLHQDLDVADLMRLEIAASLENNDLRLNSIIEENIPRHDARQAVALCGLGLDIPEPTIKEATTPTSVSTSDAQPCVEEFLPANIVRVAATGLLQEVYEDDRLIDSDQKCAVDGIGISTAISSVSIADSLHVEPGDSPFNALVDAVLEDERRYVPPFEPARSPWEVILEGLAGLTASSTSTQAVVNLGFVDAAERSPQSSPSIDVQDPEIPVIPVDLDESRRDTIARGLGSPMADFNLGNYPGESIGSAKTSRHMSGSGQESSGTICEQNYGSFAKKPQDKPIPSTIWAESSRGLSKPTTGMKYKRYIPQAPMLPSAARRSLYQDCTIETTSEKSADDFPSFSDLPEIATLKSSHPAGPDSFRNGGAKQKFVSSSTAGTLAGLGLGLPLSLTKKLPSGWNPLVKHQAHGQLSTAEECQNLAQLAPEKIERGSSRTKSGKVSVVQRKFGGRKLSDIPEETKGTSPLISSLLVFSPRINRGSDKGSRIRENSRRSFKSIVKHARAPVPAQRIGLDHPSKTNSTALPVPDNTIPSPPSPTRSEGKTSTWQHIMSRLSFSSSGSPKVERSPEGEIYPNTTEHRDIPRGLGFFRSSGPLLQKSDRSKSNFIGKLKMFF